MVLGNNQKLAMSNEIVIIVGRWGGRGGGGGGKVGVEEDSKVEYHKNDLVYFFL